MAARIVAEIWLGRRRIAIRLHRGERALVIEESLGFKASVPLVKILGDLSLDRLHDLLDPIFAEAVRRRDRDERQLLAAQRRRIKERDKLTCRYCGRKGDARWGPDHRPWHIDHIDPMVAGGSDDDANLVLACATCNLSKQARDFDDFEIDVQETGRLRVVSER